MQIPFDNRYVTLGEGFFDKTGPSPVKKPELIKFNDELAGELGISTDNVAAEGAAIFSGNTLPGGAEPLAMAYAGHQFGQFNPQLGDGRALLLGEINRPDGTRFDIHLKGSGRTRYSRNGDGRSALGPVLREYLVSEAMCKLNVPTTRALAAVTTGEPVARERLLPGGVITRIASSFVRVGTFEYFAARKDYTAVQQLADYVIEKSYPQLGGNENPYIAFLAAVVERQATLIAKWMQTGFIHGVMNTDNMSIAGETIDYGPCAFMDTYQHDQVFSSIDRHGRYAYNNQPSMGLWNLSRLAEALLPLLDENRKMAVDVAHEVLEGFEIRYESAWLAGMREKCGLTVCGRAESRADKPLIEDLLDIMADNRADFSVFHALHAVLQNPCVQQEGKDAYMRAPEPEEVIEYTFCGT